MQFWLLLLLHSISFSNFRQCHFLYCVTLYLYDFAEISKDHLLKAVECSKFHLRALATSIERKLFFHLSK